MSTKARALRSRLQTGDLKPNRFGGMSTPVRFEPDPTERVYCVDGLWCVELDGVRMLRKFRTAHGAYRYSRILRRIVARAYGNE